MKRNRILEELFRQFDDCAKEFCGKTNGNVCDITAEYKGEEKLENLKYRKATVEYNGIRISFTYTARAYLGASKNILECFIDLDKTSESVAIPLYFVADYYDVNTIVPLTVPFISNKDVMKQAFDCLISVLEQVFPRIEKMNHHPQEKEALLLAFAREMNALFHWGIEDSDQLKENFYLMMNDSAYQYLTLRFTTGLYQNFLKGRYDKALKKLIKTKEKLGYENRLVKLWQQPSQEEIKRFDQIQKNAILCDETALSKENFREFWAIAVGCLILFPVFSLAYCGVYGLMYGIEQMGAVHLMGPIYGFPYCVLAAFITSLCASYFFRFAIYKRMYKQHYDQFCETDSARTGAGEVKFMKGFLYFLFLASLVLMFLFCKWNIKFEQEGFVDNARFFSLESTYHSYEEVEKVFYKPNRVNGLGNVIEYPSYVMELKDGTQLDFYELAEMDSRQDEVLAFLSTKGIPVVSNAVENK